MFSRKIRSVGICELRGADQIRCGGGLQCCHIITRSNLGLRYEENNAISGCEAHHVYYTNHPLEWLEIIREVYPEKYDYVIKNRNVFKKPDYKEIIKQLKQYDKN